MQMTNASDNNYVTFGKPEIAPRVYIVKGPSGWNEVFQRRDSDEALKRFLAPLPVEEALSIFIAQRELSDNKEATDWFTIVGFIGRTMSMSPRAVPHQVGVAFWGQVLIRQESESKEAN